MCEQVLYLKHVIFAAGVSLNLALLRVFDELPLPTSVRDLSSFLIFVNFYFDIIDEQTALIFSLYDLTAVRISTEPVYFTPKDVERFAGFTRRLSAAPRLAQLNFNAPSLCKWTGRNCSRRNPALARHSRKQAVDVSLFQKDLTSAYKLVDVRAQVPSCYLRP